MAARPGFGLKEPFPGFPPPLTTRPEGLLSMLGLQSNGRYPQHLEMETLGVGLDLTNWYLESKAQILNVTNIAFTAGAVGVFQSLFQVPANQVWVLLNATFEGNAIATNCTIQGARARNNDFGSKLALTDPASWLPGTLPLCPMRDSVRYLILRPTVHVGFILASGGIPNNFMTATLRVVQCQV